MAEKLTPKYTTELISHFLSLKSKTRTFPRQK